MDTDTDVKRRALLRAAFDALAALDRELPVSGFDAESIAVEQATEALKDGFDKDVAPTCEACSGIILFGDEGQRCREGELLCAECAATWADIKEQWDDGTLQEDEDEKGERACFMARYEAHIAGGGSPNDKLIYPL